MDHRSNSSGSSGSSGSSQSDGSHNHNNNNDNNNDNNNNNNSNNNGNDNDNKNLRESSSSAVSSSALPHIEEERLEELPSQRSSRSASGGGGGDSYTSSASDTGDGDGDGSGTYTIPLAIGDGDPRRLPPRMSTNRPRRNMGASGGGGGSGSDRSWNMPTSSGGGEGSSPPWSPNRKARLLRTSLEPDTLSSEDDDDDDVEYIGLKGGDNEDRNSTNSTNSSILQRTASAPIPTSTQAGGTPASQQKHQHQHQQPNTAHVTFEKAHAISPLGFRGNKQQQRRSMLRGNFSPSTPNNITNTQSFRRTMSLGDPDASSTSHHSSHSSGGFTSNLTRKSQNFRNSVVRRSTALARFTTWQSTLEDDDAENAVSTQMNSVYRYNLGDPTLVSNHNSRWANCVNRHGFPKGSGNSGDEQRGPYIYVLGTIKTIHYEENAIFYTVTRADTNVDVRGDPGFMEPLLNKAGEEAARQAATEFALGTSLEEEGEEEDENAPMEGNENALKALENILEVLLLPFFLIYDLFVLAIGARLFRWAEAVFLFLRRQAHSFLNGLSPYHCSTTVTTVNIIVLCSVWYMFIDQARLAFFPTGADYVLAVFNFVIWCVLAVELALEIFIRPDDYRRLIRSDKAYTPTTVRFISGLHLAVEFVSLVFFVPEFLCLYTETSCDGRPTFSFSHATLMAVTGPTRLQSFAGRAFYACVRLRVFGLVRHWKNMWINTKFQKRDKTKSFSSRSSMVDFNSNGNLDKTDKMDSDDGDMRSSLRVSVPRNRREQKQRDAALINASNIGTALMVTNSYRALTILCAILGILPMITLIYYEGVANSVTTDMIEQLQAINTFIQVENETTCDYFVDSVEAWAKSWHSRSHNLITSCTEDFLLAMSIEPARCNDQFEGLMVGKLEFSIVACKDLASSYEFDIQSSQDCIQGTLVGTNGDDLQSIAQNFDLRVGNLQSKVGRPTTEYLDLEDGTSSETEYQVAAYFNQTHAIESSALASFLLQFCLLMTVLGGLSVLRRDAENMVLGPLRSMLKIVARYAKNPLSQAPSSSKDHLSVMSESESEGFSLGSEGDGSEGDGFGTYETEQLITAVAKITDLLRKCWGVAGADIISTNLASREGTFAEVFNPTVPGKSVYALFAFAAINGFDHALKCLGGDVMILINDVAAVLHSEVYRWGFGDSGQCNKNLGATFLMVFRIGLVKEVIEKLEEATRVVFSTSDTKKTVKKRNKVSPAHQRGGSDNSRLGSFARIANGKTAAHTLKHKNSSHEHDAMADAMKLSLQSLPGIATFTDRAVIGMLKSFAGIHRDNKLRGWSRDFRLSAGVGAFEVNMIFGMDAGWAVEGAVGSEYKIDATYLSPHVNMASRMMSACKHYGVTILLSEAVQELMSDAAKSKLRNVDSVTVKGSVRIQKIFTFDARHKGADFFLFSRSDDLAEMDAEEYVPSIWSTDQDLQAMRHHVTDDFEAEFNAGLKAYYSGDWPAAIRKLESANEIMVDAAMEEGYLHDEMDDSPDRKELYRNETADGPCSYLVSFMKSKGSVAPDGWAGWHPLLSK